MSRILSRQEIGDLLRKTKVGRLGLSHGDTPYIIPLCFIYYLGALYFHCSPVGRKMDYLKGNNKACYQVDLVGEVIPAREPCKYNHSFQSVLAEGTLSVVGDNKEKHVALQQLVKKYGGAEAAARLNPEDTGKVAVLKLTISSLNGRAVGQGVQVGTV